MIIQSTRFGELDIATTDVINFPHGIPGFPDEKTFVAVVSDPDSPFSFLQSATEANLTFLLANPFTFFNDYEFILEDEAAQELRVSAEKPPQVFIIATLKAELADMTANLLAPLVINGQERIGRQIVLDKSNYGTRHPLFPNGLPKQAAQGGK